MDENDEKQEKEEIKEDNDFSSEVTNLSSALYYLMELNGEALSEKRQARLSRMKRQIFDSLSYYCECLPQPEEDEKE